MTSHLPAAASTSRPPAAHWQASPFLKASAALHLGAGGLALAAPGLGWAALGAVLADHALIAAAGLWPRSSLLGHNLKRLPAPAAAQGCVALTIDDGPDPRLTPHVLDLLDRHAGQHATFFCIGERVQRHAALAREIVRRGHAIENHSSAHRLNFSLFGPRAVAAEIDRAQRQIADATGRAPRFFRAPAGLRNPFLDPLLQRRGLTLASWTRRGFDTRERNPARVLDRLTQRLAAGDMLLLHDGHGAIDRHGQPVLTTVLPALLQRMAAQGLRSITLDEAVPPTGPAA